MFVGTITPRSVKKTKKEALERTWAIVVVTEKVVMSDRYWQIIERRTNFSQHSSKSPSDDKQGRYVPDKKHVSLNSKSSLDTIQDIARFRRCTGIMFCLGKGPSHRAACEKIALDIRRNALWHRRRMGHHCPSKTSTQGSAGYPTVQPYAIVEQSPVPSGREILWTGRQLEWGCSVVTKERFDYKISFEAYPGNPEQWDPVQH